MNILNNYKGVTSFLLQFLNTSLSLIKVIISANFTANKLPNATSKSCVILGNGPSLTSSLFKYESALNNHSLMCVNNFASTLQFEQLKPSYYVMLDPSYWSTNPTKAVQDCFSNLSNKTNWPLHLLVPTQAKKSANFTNFISSNKNIKIHYFNYIVFKGFSVVAHFFFKNNLATPQCQNILVACLFLSINIGFKNIYLLGADHTWHQNLHINQNNDLCLKDVHFYDNIEQTNYRLFYKDASHTKTFTMHEILTTLSKAFYGYKKIKDYADSRNVAIYNASEISFIDAFTRTEIK